MIKPNTGRLLVEVEEQAPVSQGGIVTITVAPHSTGIIRKLGPTKEQQFLVGDKVMFPVYAGIELVFNNVKYRLLHYEEVYGAL